MAWTAPIVRSTGYVVTATDWNTFTGDNPTFLHTMHGCSLSKATDQNFTNATDTALTWNQEDFDTDVLHDNTTNNSRITVPTGMAGKWVFTCQVLWTGNAAGVRRVWFRTNGTTAIGGDTQTGVVNQQGVTYSRTVVMAAGDYMEAMGFQNSGGGLAAIAQGTIAGGSPTATCYFEARYLGA